MGKVGDGCYGGEERARQGRRDEGSSWGQGAEGGRVEGVVAYLGGVVGG